MFDCKLGRRPPRHTGKTRRSLMVMNAHLTALGPAPAATNDYVAAVKVPWRYMWNDQLGDCVCADTGHTMMLRTANTGGIVIPSANEILKLYEEVGGYVPGDPSTDQGCDEVTMEEFLQKTGFIGHKLDQYGSVDFANFAHLVWTVQLFGSCRLGINLPNWAENAFSDGHPWGTPPAGADTTIAGGHDVPLVDYRNGYFKCVTWGQIQLVSMEFLNMYCEEAHAELDFDWIRKQGEAPSGFNLNQLAADLAAVE